MWEFLGIAFLWAVWVWAVLAVSVAILVLGVVGCAFAYRVGYRYLILKNGPPRFRLPGATPPTLCTPDLRT